MKITRPRPLLPLALLGVLLAPPVAAARVPALVDGRYGKLIKEVSHRVDVRVHGLIAETTVTRALRSTSGAPEEAIVNFTTPPRAVVVKLEARLGGRWVRGALLSAAAVRRTVKVTRKLPKRYDPAWLEQSGVNRYRLRVYPVPTAGKILVRYSYLHPVTLRWGRRVFVYPRRGSAKNLSTALVTIRDRSPFGRAARRYRIRVAAKTTLEKPLADAAIAARTPVRASFFVTSPRRGQVGHALLMVQGNPHASRRRWGTDVVFLVDRSRSMWLQSDRTAAAILRSTLAQLGRRTRFAVVAFSRGAKPLHRRLQPASRAAVRRAIKRLGKVKLANGTTITGGLKAAYKLLGRRRTARRRLLVLLTDGLLPERHQSGLGWPTAPKNTEILILQGRPFSGVTYQLRKGPFAALARRQGGVAYAFDPRVHEDGSPAGDKASHKAAGTLAASLARPGRLSDLALRVDGRKVTTPQRELALLGGFLRHRTFTGTPPKKATLGFGYWGKRRTVTATARKVPARWAKALAAVYSTAVGRGVGPKRSLIVVDPKDAFGQDRLRFALRWGGRFFRRMSPPGALDLAVGPFRTEHGVAKAPAASSRFAPGRLTKKMIHRLLSKHYLRAATRCYQATGPRFKKGRAVLYMDLTRGEVTDVWLAHSTMKNRTLHRCLVKAALALHVNRSWGDETLYRVTYPMRFRPAKRAASELRGWRPPRKRPSRNPLRGLF